jgi:hypothetical protein
MLPVKSNSSVQSTPSILYLPDINVLKLFGKNGLKIMTRRTERNIEDTLGEDQFKFRKGKGNIAYFNYLESIITNDAQYTHKIIFRTAMAKAAFTRRKTLLTNKLDFNLRKKVMKCYISNTALYDAKTWMLQKVHHIYLENSEIWSWR